VNFVTQDDIERINRFVGLQRPRNNKQMIELYLFLVVGFFMFFFGTSMVLHFNLLKSNWMIFAVFALVLLIWGTILIRNYMKRQIDYFLICGAIGLYYAAEFFSLGYTV
jgi:membrane protein CcdC involved in cytochrome C biogenesis